MKAVLWAGVARQAITRRLQQIPNLQLSDIDTGAELATAIAAAEILVLPAHFYKAEVAQLVHRHAPRLRFLQTTTAGYEALQQHRVPPAVVVANAGDSFSPAVAEHAMALLLALVRCLPEAVLAQQRQAWARPQLARMDTLAGKTVAVIGMGSIGREFAARARVFGMSVLAVSRSARPEPLADEVFAITALHTVLARADVVLVAAPYSAATHHLLGAPELAACKAGALLINIARGALVDTTALIAALREGPLGGAAIDVSDPEPLPANHPLWEAPNLLVTPHVGGAGGAAGDARLADTVAANVARFVAGEPIRYRVVP